MPGPRSRSGSRRRSRRRARSPDRRDACGTVRCIAGELLVVAPPLVDVGLEQARQLAGPGRVGALEDGEARLGRDEVAHRDRRRLRVELERLAVVDLARMEAVQRPVAALHRVLLMGHRLRHVDAVRDAGAVGDDERRARPGVGLQERLGGLQLVGAHRDLGDVDVAVGAGDRAEVLLARCSCRRPRTWPPRRAASPSTPGRRCWSTPRCRARGC